MGKHLGFEAAVEVEASESAWVDVVWFDRRVTFDSLSIRKPRMRHHPVLPVVGFEIELKTGLNAKHIKGSVSNLDNLGAQLGVVVLGAGNVDAALAASRAAVKPTREQAEKALMSRVYRWVYAEAQPRNRVVIMTEPQVRAWARKVGLEA